MYTKCMKIIVMCIAALMLLVMPQPAIAVEATPAATQATVDYTLPYPGLLPDSPLYFVKQIRDWIMDKLVNDPVKKAEFNVLQADKRLSMGVMLIEKGNGALAEQTISKGEKYMNSAVLGLVGVKSQGGDVPSATADLLTRSLAKHSEVLQDEITKVQGAEKSGLSASLTLVKSLQSDLEKLK